MPTLGRSASSYYARARKSAWIVPSRFSLACALLSALSIYARAQAPAKAPLPQDAAALVAELYSAGVDRPAAEKALAAMKGSEAVPALLDDLGSKPRHERYDLHLLGLLGAKALPVLLDQLEVPARAPAAARVLSLTITQASGASAPRLIACVKRPATRSDCGVSLVRVAGPKSAAAVPALTELLRSSDRDERLYAAMALRQVGVKNPPVSAALRTAVDDSDEEIRGFVRKAVGWKPAPKAAPAKAGSKGPAKPAPGKVKPAAAAVRVSTVPHRGAP